MGQTEIKTGQPEVQEINHAQGRELLDREAQRLLGIPGDEFLRRWDGGEFMEAEDPNVNAVALLIPFAR